MEERNNVFIDLNLPNPEPGNNARRYLYATDEQAAHMRIDGRWQEILGEEKEAALKARG